jgi:hypothetical protein
MMGFLQITLYIHQQYGWKEAAGFATVIWIIKQWFFLHDATYIWKLSKIVERYLV